MNTESIKQRINNHIETRKNLWTAFIVLTGGIVTILLDVDSFIKVLLLVAGIMSDILIINSVVYNSIKIEQLIIKIEGDEK